MLLALLALCGIMCGNIGVGVGGFESGTLHQCGAAIDEALNLLCENGFRHKIAYDNDALRNLLYAPHKRNALNFGGPWYYLDAGGASLLRVRRRQIGVFDECCVKGCTTTELKAYCR